MPLISSVRRHTAKGLRRGTAGAELFACLKLYPTLRRGTAGLRGSVSLFRIPKRPRERQSIMTFVAKRNL